jgi:predicted DCC family thiol-disulfide oxidoreductase YuxK
VHTEITEYDKEWLFYDADCALCTAWARRLEQKLHKHAVAIAPLQSATAITLLGRNLVEPNRVALQPRRNAILPLPKGEGRGEGEGSIRTPIATDYSTANANSICSLGAGVRDELTEMKLRTASGEILGGADALIYLAKYFWWGRGLRLVARVPGVKFVLRRAYAGFAKRRHCLKGGCRL